MNPPKRAPQPLTEVGVKRHLAKCGRHGEAKTIEAIGAAIENDWRGIFEPKPDCKAQTIPDRVGEGATRVFA